MDGLLLSPITAAGILLCIGLNGKTCSQCSETVRSTAITCRYCRNELPIELTDKIEEEKGWQPSGWFGQWALHQAERHMTNEYGIYPKPIKPIE